MGNIKNVEFDKEIIDATTRIIESCQKSSIPVYSITINWQKVKLETDSKVIYTTFREIVVPVVCITYQNSNEKR